MNDVLQNMMEGGCMRDGPSILDDPSILGGGCWPSPEPMPTLLDKTLAERGNQYGDYSNMSALAQSLKVKMRASENWEQLPPWEQESLDVIATKIARILTGARHQRDSWHDIGGYAKLAEDRCPLPHELNRSATP